MRPELLVHLRAVQQRGRKVLTYLHGYDYAQYLQDERTRLAVERLLEHVGEGLSQASRSFPDLEKLIPELPRVVAFRNVLAHDYLTTLDELVWRNATEALPSLLRNIDSLLGPSSLD